MVASSIVVYATFLHAFFNNHTAIISINNFGEATLEFFLIPLMLVSNFWVIYIIFKKQLIGEFIK